MSSHAAAGLSVSPGPTNFFHHSLCDRGQEPLHVHNAWTAKTDPSVLFNPVKQSFWSLCSGSSQVSLQSPVDELLTRVQSAGHLSYLGNALRTLHGHICTSALTSLLFLTPARRWWLLL